MYTISIDEAGYIDNPCFINNPEPTKCQKAWGAVVFRRGKKIKRASFLPKKNHGEQIRVSGIPSGIYLEFCSITDKGKTHCLYVVDQSTEREITLLPVADAAVPNIYDIESMSPISTYIFEAKLAMMEAQMDDLRRLILDLKGATP